jgi:hypothetical protein
MWRRSIKSCADLLNFLVQRHNYRTYLEIGVGDPRNNFDKVQAPVKHGVDPAPQGEATHLMTSDVFFAARPLDTFYDLILIDGLHLAEQVERDINNSIACLSPGGRIVLHDCNPLTEDAQTEGYDGVKVWNGTVWKAWLKLRASRSDLSMCVVNIDNGCGVISSGSQSLYSAPTLDYANMSYAWLALNRRAALNLVTPDAFVRRAR